MALSEHSKVTVKVSGLSLEIQEGGTNWLTSLLDFRMPWEWNETTRKKVLNNVSFEVKCGQMLSILGESGSGKTSLLDVMACRTPINEITGHALFNNEPLSLDVFRSCGAYVRQEERLLPHLSVKETLTFVAQLKLSSSLTQAQIEERVTSVIYELGLIHVSDSKVGGENVRGISGGERRRVSIAVQLLQDPSVVFLDEPTSGLDSFTAHHMVETLKNLADAGRTVIMSIHQPRSDIFELFGQVMLVSYGDVVYYGEATDMLDYFTDLGYPCPEFTNPCDYYVDLVTIEMQSLEMQDASRLRIQSLVNTFQQRQAVQQDQENELTVSLHQAYTQTSCFRQFAILTRRGFKSNIEDYAFLGIQAIEALFMSVMIGLVYYDLKLTQTDIRDRFAMLFIAAALYPYLVVIDVIGKYHAERKTIYYEMMDGLYTFGPYFFAKIISEIPEQTVFMMLYAIPFYWMAGLQNDIYLFLKLYATSYMITYCSRSMSLWAGSVMPTFQSAVLCAQIIYTMFLLSCGFIINLDNLFIGAQWIAKISYLKWGYQALTDIQIKGLKFQCDFPPNLTHTCIVNGTQALESFSLTLDSLWIPMVILAGEILIFFTLFYVCGRLISQKPHEA